jgi:hypothetical protein
MFKTEHRYRAAYDLMAMDFVAGYCGFQITPKGRLQRFCPAALGPFTLAAGELAYDKLRIEQLMEYEVLQPTPAEIDRVARTIFAATTRRNTSEFDSLDVQEQARLKIVASKELSSYLNR